MKVIKRNSIENFKAEMMKSERKMFLKEIKLKPYSRWLWLTKAVEFVKKVRKNGIKGG